MEAASLLGRRLAAMEALLTARRQAVAQQVAAVAAEPEIPSFMQPPPAVRTSGPGAGNGFESILQVRRAVQRSAAQCSARC